MAMAVTSIIGEKMMMAQTAPTRSTRSLYKCIECIGQRHMADIDHRKPHQILRVRTGRDDIIVIRNELCMHAGFLTDRHDMLQLGILA